MHDAIEPCIGPLLSRVLAHSGLLLALNVPLIPLLQLGSQLIGVGGAGGEEAGRDEYKENGLHGLNGRRVDR